MKLLLSLIGRVGLILLAALAVVAIAMSIVDTDTATRFPPNDQGEFSQADATVLNTEEGTDETTQGAITTQQEVRGPRGDHGLGGHGGNQSLGSRLSAGLFGLLKNSVIIGIVALVVVWLSKVFSSQSTVHSLNSKPTTLD